MEDSQKISLPKNLDIEEVLDTSDEDHEIYAGNVETWSPQDLLEKSKLRPYIAITVVSVWTASVIASAIKFLLTGDFLLAVPSTAITVPLCIILGFYFERSRASPRKRASSPETKGTFYILLQAWA
jgi:uncharacterized membrane protein